MIVRWGLMLLKEAFVFDLIPSHSFRSVSKVYFQQQQLTSLQLKYALSTKHYGWYQKLNQKISDLDRQDLCGLLPLSRFFSSLSYLTFRFRLKPCHGVLSSALIFYPFHRLSTTTDTKESSCRYRRVRVYVVRDHQELTWVCRLFGVKCESVDTSLNSYPECCSDFGS